MRHEIPSDAMQCLFRSMQNKSIDQWNYCVSCIIWFDWVFQIDITCQLLVAQTQCLIWQLAPNNIADSSENQNRHTWSNRLFGTNVLLLSHSLLIWVLIHEIRVCIALILDVTYCPLCMQSKFLVTIRSFGWSAWIHYPMPPSNTILALPSRDGGNHILCSKVILQCKVYWSCKINLARTLELETHIGYTLWSFVSDTANSIAAYAS